MKPRVTTLAPSATAAIPPPSPTETVTAGGRVAYTVAGSGDVVLLVHGLGGTRRTWRRVFESLSRTHTVIAPDLPGHGASPSPAGDYSLGAHATALRDLLLELGHTSASVVGHSLGGGVALTFAYQFPERTERLALISSGGLGPEVTPALRAVSVPGSGVIVAGLSVTAPLLSLGLPPLSRLAPKLVARQDVASLTSGLSDLRRPRHRRAFVRTARSVINWRGQAVSAEEQLKLLKGIPVLMAWGTRDRTIPPSRQLRLDEQRPDAHVVEIDGAGHYPHESAADQLLPCLRHFLTRTTPFVFDEREWGRRLRTQSFAS